MVSTWRRGEPTPARFTSGYGTATVHGNTAYFSCTHDIYLYTVLNNEWTKLAQCECQHFSMVVIDGKLTTIGGRKGCDMETNVLLSLIPGRLFGNSWKEVFPPMPTKRAEPAAITTHTHLVVAGGNEGFLSDRDTVEVLDTTTQQWFTADSLPLPASFPQMTLCGGHIYLSNHDTVFSCSVEELLKSCKPIPTSSSDGVSMWTRLVRIPEQYASLVTVSDRVLAIGGSEDVHGDHPTASIHGFDRATNSWSVIGQLPTPLRRVLTVVLPTNEVIVVGGMKGSIVCYDTYIAKTKLIKISM